MDRSTFVCLVILLCNLLTANQVHGQAFSSKVALSMPIADTYVKVVGKYKGRTLSLRSIYDRAIVDLDPRVDWSLKHTVQKDNFKLILVDDSLADRDQFSMEFDPGFFLADIFIFKERVWVLEFNYDKKTKKTHLYCREIDPLAEVQKAKGEEVRNRIEYSRVEIETYPGKINLGIHFYRGMHFCESDFIIEEANDLIAIAYSAPNKQKAPKGKLILLDEEMQVVKKWVLGNLGSVVPVSIQSMHDGTIYCLVHHVGEPKNKHIVIKANTEKIFTSVLVVENGKRLFEPKLLSNGKELFVSGMFSNGGPKPVGVVMMKINSEDLSPITFSTHKFDDENLFDAAYKVFKPSIDGKKLKIKDKLYSISSLIIDSSGTITIAVERHLFGSLTSKDHMGYNIYFRNFYTADFFGDLHITSFNSDGTLGLYKVITKQLEDSEKVFTLQPSFVDHYKNGLLVLYGDLDETRMLYLKGGRFAGNAEKLSFMNDKEHLNLSNMYRLLEGTYLSIIGEKRLYFTRLDFEL